MDMDKYVKGHFAKCVEYIKANLEPYDIQRGWAEIGKRMPLPQDIADKIFDLIDDYNNDNELTDDWWDDFDAEDFFMEIDNN